MTCYDKSLNNKSSFINIKTRSGKRKKVNGSVKFISIHPRDREFHQFIEPNPACHRHYQFPSLPPFPQSLPPTNPLTTPPNPNSHYSIQREWNYFPSIVSPPKIFTSFPSLPSSSRNYRISREIRTRSSPLKHGNAFSNTSTRL